METRRGAFPALRAPLGGGTPRRVVDKQF